MTVKRPIDTEPDDAFEAVFGDVPDEPVLAGPVLAGPVLPGTKGPDQGPDDDPDLLDLDGIELSDEIDEALWAQADPERGDKALGPDEPALAATPAAPQAAPPDPEAPGGTFDALAAEALRARWMARLDAGQAAFCLDLTRAAGLDAAGLAFMAAFARELEAKGGRLTVAAAGPVRDVLDLCGLGRAYPVDLLETGEDQAP